MQYIFKVKRRLSLYPLGIAIGSLLSLLYTVLIDKNLSTEEIVHSLFYHIIVVMLLVIITTIKLIINPQSISMCILSQKLIFWSLPLDTILHIKFITPVSLKPLPSWQVKPEISKLEITTHKENFFKIHLWVFQQPDEITQLLKKYLIERV